MAMTFPLAASDFWETLRFAGRPELELAPFQKQSIGGNGKILRSRFGTPKWMAAVQLASGRHDANIEAAATLKAMLGRGGSFLAYDIRRPFPKADPLGAIIAAGSPVVLGGEAGFGDVANDNYRYEGLTVTRSQALSIVSDAGTRINASGVVEAMAANALRVDYDAVTHAVRGILCEPAFSNLLLRSEELDNAGWSKTRATVTANALAAPDGTTTADKIVDTTDAANTHQVQQNYTGFVSGQSYTASGFFKAGELGFVQVAFNGAAFSTPQRASINLSTGATSVVQGAPTVAVQAMGGGWYRFSVTAVATATGSAAVIAYLADATNNVSFTGTGTSGLYAWGLQLNGGTVAYSYLKTTSAIVARAADAITWRAKGTNAFALTYDDASVSNHAGISGNWTPAAASLSRVRVKGWTATRSAQPGAPTVQVQSKGGDNISLSLKGLPAGYQLSSGDKISVTNGSGLYALLELMAAVTAAYDGTTGLVEVQPFLPVWVAVNQTVIIAKAPGRFGLSADGYSPSGGEGNIASGAAFSMVSE